MGFGLIQERSTGFSSQTASYSPTMTWDWMQYSSFGVMLEGDCSFFVSNAIPGTERLLRVQQNADGGHTLTSPSVWIESPPILLPGSTTLYSVFVDDLGKVYFKKIAEIEAVSPAVTQVNNFDQAIVAASPYENSPIPSFATNHSQTL